MCSCNKEALEEILSMLYDLADACEELADDLNNDSVTSTDATFEIIKEDIEKLIEKLRK